MRSLVQTAAGAHAWMEVLVEHQGSVEASDVLTVALYGEIDLAQVEAIAVAADQATAQEASCLRLDVRGVTFMDSQGVRAILEAHRLLAGRRVGLAVVGAPRQVRRVLSITGADRVVDLES